MTAGTREHLVSRLRAFLLARESGDPRRILDLEGMILAADLAMIAAADDTQAWHLVAVLHRLRYQVLPPGEDRVDLYLSMTAFAHLMEEARQLVPDDVRAFLAEPGRTAIALSDSAEGCNRRALQLLQDPGPATDLGAVDIAVALLERALAATPDTDPRRGGYGANLCLARRHRFDLSGDVASLDGAVIAGRAAVAATPSDTPDRPAVLSALASALRARFEHSGKSIDLDEAVEFGRAVVAEADQSDDARVGYLSNLGAWLRARFERGGPVRDIDESILLGRSALAAATIDDPRRPACGSNLGLALRARYERSGALPDLDEAVAVTREAVSALPRAHSDRAAVVSNLGVCLQVRFDRFGLPGDLTEAVSCCREAAELTPEASPDVAIRLSNLSAVLQTNFEHTGALDDIEEAIRIGRDAVSREAGRQDRALCLASLGVGLKTRHDRLGEPADLTEAIAAILVTNVPSTGKPMSGTFDTLQAALDKLGADLGIEMSCLWREAIDAMVDSAPDSLKWTYADMLAGWDLIRYLIAEQFQPARGDALRELVRRVAATQWDEDDKVKFSQVDVDRERVADLFIDVTAERIRVPEKVIRLVAAGSGVGGAAAYLLGTGAPFTLVRGAPGQGKSTLGQYVCQAHRAAFVLESMRTAPLPNVAEPRFPLRFDLGSYAAWLTGVDVFDPSERTTQRRGRKRRAAESTVECFLAELMTHASGGIPVTATDVHSLFERVPALVLLDGLDEVGRLGVRRQVVAAIDSFCSRGRSYTVPPRIVVTTRPSTGELPEPSPTYFEVLVLNPLEPEQRNEYLRKWCTVRGIHGSEGRALRTTFKQKSAEPYIAELAGNPMHLTILLELLHQQGLATPTQRTELYDAYLSLLLAREANKHPDSVRKHRKDLLEIIPFLGWYLQSRSEERGLSGRMPTDELVAAMKHFQRTYGKSEAVVDELFEATTDRLWALTSKDEGIYEFEVVSLREYFAARYLYNFAGEGDPKFDRASVFRELLRRPYWLNTARFYGGNAQGSDVYVLAAAIREELSTKSTRHVHIAAWTLLTDGVLASRPAEAASVLEAPCGDTGVPLLLEALDRKEIRPLPQLPSQPIENPTWNRLTAAIAADPADAGNPQRTRVLRELLSQRGPFAHWWVNHATAAVGTTHERSWVALAAECEAASGAAVDLEGVDLAGPGAQDVLNTGVMPPVESKLEEDLLRAVLDGQCPDTASIRSMPAQVAVALSPHAFYTTSDTGFNGQSEAETRRRQDAVSGCYVQARLSAPSQPSVASRPASEAARSRGRTWHRRSSITLADAGLHRRSPSSARRPRTGPGTDLNPGRRRSARTVTPRSSSPRPGTTLTTPTGGSKSGRQPTTTSPRPSGSSHSGQSGQPQ